MYVVSVVAVYIYIIYIYIYYDNKIYYYYIHQARLSKYYALAILCML